MGAAAAGFDFCYDKKLYDAWNTAMPKASVSISCGYGLSDRLIRFIENHDEPARLKRFRTKNSMLLR